jgi:hypothetical protein
VVRNIFPSAFGVPRHSMILNMISSLGTSQYATSKFCPKESVDFGRILP